MSLICIDLPWPPSANTYWRRNGSRYFISTKGMTFRKATAVLCHKYRGAFGASSRLSISICAYPPDKRKRDLDNLFKSVLDSLQYATVFVDDSQVDELAIKRMPENLGQITVCLERIE